MLNSLLRDVRARSHDGLIRAARRAYLLTLLAVAVPGLPLGLGFLLTHPTPVSLPALLGLLLLAALLSGAALHFARKVANNTDLPAQQTALSGAIQAATAPAVPFLLGCTALAQPLALLLFWALALALHALIWTQLPGWVRQPEAPTGTK